MKRRSRCFFKKSEKLEKKINYAQNYALDGFNRLDGFNFNPLDGFNYALDGFNRLNMQVHIFISNIILVYYALLFFPIIGKIN